MAAHFPPFLPSTFLPFRVSSAARVTLGSGREGEGGGTNISFSKVCSRRAVVEDYGSNAIISRIPAEVTSGEKATQRGKISILISGSREPVSGTLYVGGRGEGGGGSTSVRRFSSCHILAWEVKTMGGKGGSGKRKKGKRKVEQWYQRGTTEGGRDSPRPIEQHALEKRLHKVYVRKAREIPYWPKLPLQSGALAST